MASNWQPFTGNSTLLTLLSALLSAAREVHAGA